MLAKTIKEKFDKLIARRMAALISMFIKFSYRISTRAYLEQCRFTVRKGDKIIFDSSFNQLQDYLEANGAYFHQF